MVRSALRSKRAFAMDVEGGLARPRGLVTGRGKTETLMAKISMVNTFLKGRSQTRIEMIEHHIDNDPRHRHVEPDRKGPTGDPNVSVEAPSQCAIHRDQG